MRKFKLILLGILFSTLSMYTMVSAASVPPVTLPGNDSNPMDYTPPAGCIHYEIPNSGQEGTFTATFNETGAVDPAGAYSFTVVVGTEAGEDFTKVLSWSSNFPIYAVIVKGGNAFNLYQYDTTVRGDTDLVSPDNPSGHPADVSHVSVVICPDDFPPQPPTPTPSPSPTPSPPPTVTPTPTPCPPCPPTPPSTFCCIVMITIFILLIVAFFFIGLLLGKCSFPCWMKPFGRHKQPNETKLYVDNKDNIYINNDVDTDIDNDINNSNYNDNTNDNSNTNINIDKDKECSKKDKCGNDYHKHYPTYPDQDYFKNY